MNVNGQIYTPGLAIVDAPQPHTPLGGDTLHVAIDISGNGRIWPPSKDSSTTLHSLTLFLTSYATSKNLTISNATDAGSVLDLEPSSTVKHVNWVWPACLAGEGNKSPRGEYNISMHQAFRVNGSEYYTVFDLPMAVANSIEPSEKRVDCSVLENDMLAPEVVAQSNGSWTASPWLGGVIAEGGSGTANGGKQNAGQRASSSVGVKGLLVVGLTGMAWML
ncbi:uncharacterized protein ACLA_010790 [Aspergillus clavatus NRRL 1]|uniref:Uncharacterized protein n=1 Tax=Aspergillus clavatus (strain ATCC 1007 / CBS 513.65 / DSM 816 / NCTC 3887 / NRRL 1 / QM 1276 / 107) TaxID=344612 RepID=A1CA85_ASPCL|nr:uncharacterized protein ACLA_010790 [Aspergillus clavatus NRRL 1]EAW12653.1 conserved hypothetical protein [Aspergillus clavatus NRRL 1]